MNINDIPSSFIRFRVYRYVVAPIFGMFCFVFGATMLFLLSAGRWRVRKWPTFNDGRTRQLEPWKERQGNYTYWSADGAVFAGFGFMLAGVLFLLGFWMIKG